MGEMLEGFAQWLIDVLLWVPRQVWAAMLDGLAAVIEAIPSPAFVGDLVVNLGTLPASMGFFFGLVAAPQGCEIILLAYFVRFCIRRLPVVG